MIPRVVTTTSEKLLFVNVKMATRSTPCPWSFDSAEWDVENHCKDKVLCGEIDRPKLGAVT